LFVIDNNECIGCGTCYKLCPFNAIMENVFEENQRYEINDEICMECSLCFKACPLRAIKAKVDYLKGGGAFD